jgi:hypothetical protein
VAVTFLTPLAAAFAVAAAVPLAVALRRERRAAAVRERLGLPPPGRRALLTTLAALVALPLLAALAAAQPVLDLTEERRERTDVEAYVVLDTSRSMLAGSGPDGAARFERAQALAAALREALPEVPLGLASLTDRTLPHLFPTTDRGVFSSALATSVGIEQPPPRLFFADRATDLDALASAYRLNYFTGETARKLLVVLTDGETRGYPQALAVAAEAAPETTLVLVPLWAEDERVHIGGVPEPAYEADPAGPETLERLAGESEAVRLVPEDAAALVEASREAVGTGPTRVAARDGSEVALMPYVTALALLPLGLLLRRRNL